MADQKRTQFAMQAFGFAELFNIKIGDQKVAGSTVYRVEMSAPDGPSTGGGKQAVQHVKLVPEVEGDAVIVAGSANQLEKSAEIRTFEYLADLHAQRFKGAPIPLDRPRYTELVKRMQAFFSDQGLRVVMLDAPRPGAGGASQAAYGAPASSSKTTAILLFLAIAAVIAGAAFFFLHK